MKIIDINVIGDNIVISLDQDASVSKLYIDTLNNDKNKYSVEDDQHTHIIENVSVSNKTITINYKTLSPELDLSAFTVLINGVLGFYYNDKELYYKEIQLLTNYCSTCLDKQQKERTLLFLLKKSLLEYATNNGLIEDQIQYYKDLARMLCIDVKYNIQNSSIMRCNECSNVKGCCCNGCCSLC